MDNEYNGLERKWEEVVNIIKDGESGFELGTLESLIYNTYNYFYEDKDSEKISRKDLPIYRNIAALCSIDTYPTDCPESVFDTAIDFANGLLVTIEQGFDTGYLEKSLPLGVVDMKSGGEVDMSSYDVFERKFQEQLEWRREEYEEN